MIDGPLGRSGNHPYVPSLIDSANRIDEGATSDADKNYELIMNGDENMVTLFRLAGLVRVLITEKKNGKHHPHHRVKSESGELVTGAVAVDLFVGLHKVVKDFTAMCLTEGAIAG